MLIPLDYYRILGVPIQATAEQLQQAHRDRTRQRPRREYSEAAIAGRKQLLNEAYEILCDPEGRSRYDASFLSKTYDRPSNGVQSEDTNGTATPDIDPQTPSIEVEDKEAIGALLVLHELGEYELVLKLGRPHVATLNRRLDRPETSTPGDAIARSDVVLALATAYLELGREQWQQKQYERAAATLEAGQALLLREGLFPNLRGEIQADVDKLRPYRILELVALPSDRESDRARAFQLLRDMLQERGGIDGSGDDRSGLNVDDFLRFIQQLRRHATVIEQQQLFEREARRPSAAATYLAAYAAIARGFTERQPGQIHRAKLMLIQLGRRQDVHLERAACCLLLGQTDRASRALELSQDEQTLTFIRERSRESPDLLPGLCFYTERWLQEEVFPHFRDLVGQQASLKTYFADERVQSHLEQLPADSEAANQWVPVGGAAQMTSLGQQPDVRQTWQTTSLSQAVATIAAPKSASGDTGNRTQLPFEPIAPRSTPDPNPFQAEPPTPKPPTDKGRLRKKTQWKVDRLVLVGAGAIVALLFLLWLLTRILAGLAAVFSGGPGLESPQPAVGINAPPVSIPEPQATPEPPSGELTPEVAAQVVRTWFEVKSAAMGPEHEIDRLDEVLVDPALSQWRGRARSYQNLGESAEYEHTLEIEEVTIDPENPDRAEVVTLVREEATKSAGGQVVESWNSPLRVRYELVRQGDRWSIRDWSWTEVN